MKKDENVGLTYVNLQSAFLTFLWYRIACSQKVICVLRIVQYGDRIRRSRIWRLKNSNDREGVVKTVSLRFLNTFEKNVLTNPC